jgi:hypothetical protein
LHESFINAGRWRHAIAAGVLVVVCALGYGLAVARHAAGGDSVIGYTLGGISGALVLMLMGYGIRRRIYAAAPGSTRGWLSMHVYFGVAVLVIAALHADFHFGANVHTLGYVLMAAVVLSGLWGVYTYLRYPTLMNRQREGASRELLLSRMAELDSEAQQVARHAPRGTRDLLTDAIARTRLGGGIWAQLRGLDSSRLLLASGDPHGFLHFAANHGQQALVAQLARQQSACRDAGDHRVLSNLLQLTGEKAVLQARLRRDIQLHAQLQVWLYLHLPLSFAAVIAVFVHVYSVFFYW